MSISIVVFVAFYYGLVTHPDKLAETMELDILLDWMYIMLGATLVAFFAGIIWSFLKKSR
jgi:hypothetical protein